MAKVREKYRVNVIVMKKEIIDKNYYIAHRQLIVKVLNVNRITCKEEVNLVD